MRGSLVEDFAKTETDKLATARHKTTKKERRTRSPERRNNQNAPILWARAVTVKVRRCRVTTTCVTQASRSKQRGDAAEWKLLSLPRRCATIGSVVPRRSAPGSITHCEKPLNAARV